VRHIPVVKLSLGQRKSVGQGGRQVGNLDRRPGVVSPQKELDPNLPTADDAARSHIDAGADKEKSPHRHGDAAAEDEAWGTRPREAVRRSAQRGNSAPQQARRGSWHSCRVLANKGFESFEMNEECTVVREGRNLADE
jgi:hypothetical protein